MLDITDRALYQNFFSVETQLTFFVVVVLFCALTVLFICKMDLLRASQHKQRFYDSYETRYTSSTLKMLHAAAKARDRAPHALPETPPLSSQASTSSHRTSASESALSAEGARDTNEFINSRPHRTCEMCRKYERTLKAARETLLLTAAAHKTEARWPETEAKATLDAYEAFIERMMRDHERARIDNQVVRLHVRNLTAAFDNLQAKYERAKRVISGYQRNERSLLGQLSKYETMFDLISERNQLFQRREMERQSLRMLAVVEPEEPEKDTSRRARGTDKQIDTKSD